MKRNIIIVCLVIVLSLFFKIPQYLELNNLKIIEGIGLDCDNKNTLYLKEIIPEKDDNGIEYKYKIHTSSNKINNNYYLNNTKYIITNCDNTSNLINKYNLNPKYIYHTRVDIKKELSENT